MTRWAIFDVDGTLLPGKSMEERFLVYHARKGFFPLRNLYYYVMTGLIYTFEGKWEKGFKGNKVYLKDMLIPGVKEAAEKFFQHRILPHFSRSGLQTLEKYRNSGYRIMIMSGSPDFLVQQLKEICRPDYVIDTSLEVFRRRYTGKISGQHPCGTLKRDILLQLHRQLDIDFDGSIAFANHHTDVYHMDLFGEAVAVNPTIKLRRMAQERGWEIERWES